MLKTAPAGFTPGSATSIPRWLNFFRSKEKADAPIARLKPDKETEVISRVRDLASQWKVEMQAIPADPLYGPETAYKKAERIAVKYRISIFGVIESGTELPPGWRLKVLAKQLAGASFFGAFYGLEFTSQKSSKNEVLLLAGMGAITFAVLGVVGAKVMINSRKRLFANELYSQLERDGVVPSMQSLSF